VKIAFLAVMMIWTLGVVLLSHVGALEVEVAVIAGPMGVGILFVLLQCSIVWEPLLAAIAIRH
jgi:hypothetical protein